MRASALHGIGSMSRLIRGGSAIVLSFALMLATACDRGKKPALPPQATAPTISVPPTPQVGQQPAPPPQTTAPPATGAQTGVIPKPSAGQTVSQPKPRSKVPGRKTTASKSEPLPTPAQPPQPQPPAQKTGDSQVMIGAQVPQGTARNTEQLLQAAENNLRRVNRTLNGGEQAMMQQVRNYISQSRTATRDGDLERAYNLANKANLLSVELAK
jgi:hypothetical protein